MQTLNLGGTELTSYISNLRKYLNTAKRQFGFHIKFGYFAVDTKFMHFVKGRNTKELRRQKSTPNINKIARNKWISQQSCRIYFISKY